MIKKKYPTWFFLLALTGFAAFLSGSCKKEKSTSITDADGNVYHAVTIGTQTWMLENLRTTRFNDGTPIEKITDSTIWGEAMIPLYCWYENNPAYANTYGAMYNLFAVNTGKLAPNGWHVATSDEWKTLRTYLGGSFIAAGKMKEKDTTHWMSPNTGADNSSGFTALPGGYLGNYSFDGLGYRGYWWSYTDGNIANGGTSFMLSYLSGSIAEYHFPGREGFSVRCVKNK
jgi:uncharacterized protein (TIGR02145 family)